MNMRFRLDFANKQIDQDGLPIGQFAPLNPTQGEVALNGLALKYRIETQSYGCTISLYQGAKQIALRTYDAHDGIHSVRIGTDTAFDLNNAVLYCPEGRAGRVHFSEKEITMDFNSLVREDIVSIVALLVAVDTMWANLVGFTRARARPRAR